MTYGSVLEENEINRRDIMGHLIKTLKLQSEALKIDFHGNKVLVLIGCDSKLNVFRR